MSTLLVLGSKPEPSLPPPGSFDSLACANASGNSAARYGLGMPRFTVVSAILTSGHKPANRLALDALRGLRTEILYLYPRRPIEGSPLRRFVGQVRNYRTRPWYVRHALRSRGYRWDEFRDPGLAYYAEIFRSLCGDDPGVTALLARKQPSSGMLALALGIALGGYARYVLAGFSFEITHAYADNPLVAERGAASRHADTDIALLRCVTARLGTVYTTEAAVQERAGVPLLPEATPARPASVAGARA